MNWVGASPAGVEGYEYHVLTLGMSVPLMLSGAGAFSVDRLIARWIDVNAASADEQTASSVGSASDG